MAEAVIWLVLRNLGDFLIQEVGLLHGTVEEIRSVMEEIRSVIYYLQRIRSLLKDADEKRHKHEMVKLWLSQIRDVAYDLEDIVDTCILGVEQNKHKNPALRFLSNSRNFFNIGKVRLQLKEMKARLDEIVTRGKRYGLNYIEPGESSSSSSMEVAPMKNSSPFVEEADVVGFEEDAEILAKALLAGESQRRAVVSIVGMGGLGKTALAKCIYNRWDVKNGFQFRAWVYVSQEYRVRDLLLSITNQVMSPLGREQETMESMTEEALKGKLLENLRGRRYLVVFDDIWAIEAWDLIKKALPDDQNGSRVMLTTRNKEVAFYADPFSNPHELHLLNEDRSWKLFCKKVFPLSSFPIEFEQLGRQIVAKAGGLPLAIVTLGGLLSTKQKAYHVWEELLIDVTEAGKLPLKVVTLSYDALPNYLKLCFLYFGMFPYDAKIEVDNLIRLWIAEGLIEKSETRTMEDIAEGYLAELVQRSMVQIIERRDDGSALFCCIHDLLKDIAISEAKKNEFLEIYGSRHSVARRLTVHPEKGQYDTDDLQYVVENLRSLLLCFGGGFEEFIWRSFCGHVKLLRVLDLSGVLIKELPKEVGELIHLRYLGLRATRLRELPAAVGNLINLQTLDLRDTAILRIPYTVEKLQRLRHLFIWSYSDQCTFCRCDWVSNSSTLNRIDDLRDLRTLELKAGIWINKGFEKLTNLRRLRIEGELGQYSQVLPNSLAKFLGLRSLHLLENSHESPLALNSFSHHMYLTELILSGPLRELPEFSPNLSYLELNRSFLEESVDPMTTLEKLRNLRTLKMLSQAYLGYKMTCSAQGFPNLHHLEISCLECLEEWMVEEGAMPNLRSLRMEACGQLKTLSDSLVHIPDMREVELVDMPKEVENWWQQSGQMEMVKIRRLSAF